MSPWDAYGYSFQNFSHLHHPHISKLTHYQRNYQLTDESYGGHRLEEGFVESVPGPVSARVHSNIAPHALLLMLQLVPLTSQLLQTIALQKQWN